MRSESERLAPLMFAPAPDSFVSERSLAAPDQATSRLGAGTDVALVRRALRLRRTALDPV